MNKKNPKQVYDTRAHIYEWAMQRLRYFTTLHAFLSHLHLNLPSSTPHILDFGCGPGTNTAILHKLFPGAQITGFDFSRKMLERYHTRFPNHHVVYGNYNEPDSFQLQQFDLIFSACSVTEYGRPEITLPWIYQHLKSGGMFIGIGIADNWIGMLSGWIWHFVPTSEKIYLAQLRSMGFQHVQPLSIAWRYFPMNVMKYAFSAQRGI